MKTIPEAIRQLFDIGSAAESTFLKDKANSFKRNGLIKVVEEQRVQRPVVTIEKNQEPVLFNALLLSSVFSDPKYVKKIFEQPETRTEATDFIRSMLLQRSNVCGIALASKETTRLISCLEGDFDLRSEKLPNPFETLPQMVLGKHTNVLTVLLAQASVLDPVDSVLAAYVAGDIEKACLLADQIKTPEPVEPLLEMIRSRQRELQRFSKLLDDFF